MGTACVRKRKQVQFNDDVTVRTVPARTMARDPRFYWPPPFIDPDLPDDDWDNFEPYPDDPAYINGTDALGESPIGSDPQNKSPPPPQSGQGRGRSQAGDKEDADGKEKYPRLLNTSNSSQKNVSTVNGDNSRGEQSSCQESPKTSENSTETRTQAMGDAKDTQSLEGKKENNSYSSSKQTAPNGDSGTIPTDKTQINGKKSTQKNTNSTASQSVDQKPVTKSANKPQTNTKGNKVPSSLSSEKSSSSNPSHTTADKHSTRHKSTEKKHPSAKSPTNGASPSQRAAKPTADKTETSAGDTKSVEKANTAPIQKDKTPTDNGSSHVSQKAKTPAIPSTEMSTGDSVSAEKKNSPATQKYKTPASNGSSSPSQNGTTLTKPSSDKPGKHSGDTKWAENETTPITETKTATTTKKSTHTPKYTTPTYHINEKSQKSSDDTKSIERKATPSTQKGKPSTTEWSSHTSQKQTQSAKHCSETTQTSGRDSKLIERKPSSVEQKHKSSVTTESSTISPKATMAARPTTEKSQTAAGDTKSTEKKRFSATETTNVAATDEPFTSSPKTSVCSKPTIDQSHAPAGDGKSIVEEPPNFADQNCKNVSEIEACAVYEEAPRFSKDDSLSSTYSTDIQSPIASKHASMDSKGTEANGIEVFCENPCQSSTTSRQTSSRRVSFTDQESASGDVKSTDVKLCPSMQHNQRNSIKRSSSSSLPTTSHHHYEGSSGVNEISSTRTKNKYSRTTKPTTPTISSSDITSRKGCSKKRRARRKKTSTLIKRTKPKNTLTIRIPSKSSLARSTSPTDIKRKRSAKPRKHFVHKRRRNPCSEGINKCIVVKQEKPFYPPSYYHRHSLDSVRSGDSVSTQSFESQRSSSIRLSRRGSSVSLRRHDERHSWDFDPWALKKVSSNYSIHSGHRGSVYSHRRSSSNGSINSHSKHNHRYSPRHSFTSNSDIGSPSRRGSKNYRRKRIKRDVKNTKIKRSHKQKQFDSCGSDNSRDALSHPRNRSRSKKPGDRKTKTCKIGKSRARKHKRN